MHPTLARSAFSLRQVWRPTVRARKVFTSSFFLVTFCGAIVTVSLTEFILPCPARVGPGQYKNKADRQAAQSSAAASSVSSGAPAEGERDSGNISRQHLVQGERVRLTKKGGWIEIEDGVTR